MMIRFALFLVLCALAPGRLLAQEPQVQPPDYYNRGIAINQVVHAKYFQNDGYFEVQNFQFNTNATTIFDPSLTPYDMSGSLSDIGSGTLGYFNNGTFRALSVRLDAVKQFGERDSSDYFVNSPSGKLDLADGFHFTASGIGFNNVVLQFFTDAGFYYAPFSSARIDAKQIWNQGLMRIGAGGFMELGTTNEFDGSYKTEKLDLHEGLLVTDPAGFAYGEIIQDSFFSQLVNRTVGSTNAYLNELGVSDVYWGVGTKTNQDASTLMITAGNTTIVTTAPYDFQDRFGFNYRNFQFSVQNPYSFGRLFVDPQHQTNFFIEAVFVGTSSSNVLADVRWTRNVYYNNASDFSQGFESPVIKISAVTTNALTFQPEENSVYIMDQLGASTNNVIIRNDRYDTFNRPNNYFVSRSVPFEYTGGLPSTITPTPGLFYNTSYSNQIVTNFFSDYVFTFDSQVYYPPTVGDVNVHDLPGRIELNAKSIDLTSAGIRAEGLVSIKTDDLQGTDGLIIDSPTLAFNLAFTNKVDARAPLQIQNLAKEQISRFRGQVEIWSGTFTNQVTGTFLGLDTNVYSLQFHVTVVDARGISPVQEVNVAEFRAKAEGIAISDNMIVSNAFQISSRSLDLKGDLELRGANWTLTNMPNLTNLVIESTASLRLSGLADFGSDAIGLPIDINQYPPIYYHPGSSSYSFRPQDFPDANYTTNSSVTRTLSNFVHHGSITSYSQRINADNVDITGGSIFSGRNELLLTVGIGNFLVYSNFFLPDSGPLYLTANRSAKLNSGSFFTYGDVNLNGPVYKLDHFNIFSGAALNLNVTSALLDSGSTAGNALSSSNSLTLSSTTPSGSLLGTEINAYPAPNGSYRYRWSVGAANASLTNIPTAATLAALSNNAANVYSTNLGVGHLFLHSGTNTTFEFRGTGLNKAIFVDLLEIDGTGITNWNSLTNQLRLVYQPNNLPGNPANSIDIYYGDIVATNLASHLPLGFYSLAEYLNGKEFPAPTTNIVGGVTNITKRGGTMHWVPSFVGPNTSEDTVTISYSTNGLGVITTNMATVRMNRALRRSQIVDLDGDGIANANDDEPLNVSRPTVVIQSIKVQASNGKAAVQFTAYQGSYQVQYTDTLINPTWKVAGTYAQSSMAATTATVIDPAPITGPRFYRLVYTQGP